MHNDLAIAFGHPMAATQAARLLAIALAQADGRSNVASARAPLAQFNGERGAIICSLAIGRLNRQRPAPAIP